jgi:hypothetical protein
MMDSKLSLFPSDLPRDELMDEAETAHECHVSRRSLQRYRREGGGPPYVRIGKRRIAYRRKMVREYLDSRTFTSTSAEGISRG